MTIDVEYYLNSLLKTREAVFESHGDHSFFTSFLLLQSNKTTSNQQVYNFFYYQNLFTSYSLNNKKLNSHKFTTIITPTITNPFHNSATIFYDISYN